MFSATFEVHPKAERFDEYLALAKRLRPILEKVDGFVDNERFESKRRPGWILSLSTWRDEKSMIRWRTTEIGVAKLATLNEITPQHDVTFSSYMELISALDLDISGDDIVDYDVFASIYNPGKFALLVLWKDAKAADQWTPLRTAGIQTLRHRKIRIVRDYGMFDRREAPQFFSDAKGHETKHPEPAR